MEYTPRYRVQDSRLEPALPYSGRRTIPLPPGWGSIAYRVIARDPVCRWGILPGEEGLCGQDSTEVDHMGDPSDHRIEVLRGICQTHHQKRTSGQANAARSRIRSLRYRAPDRHPGYVLPEKEASVIEGRNA